MAYCSACGGWDKEQQGVGHKLACPAGESGMPIGHRTEEGKVNWLLIGKWQHLDMGTVSEILATIQNRTKFKPLHHCAKGQYLGIIIQVNADSWWVPNTEFADFVWSRVDRLDRGVKPMEKLSHEINKL